jgi:hypothetical protein
MVSHPASKAILPSPHKKQPSAVILQFDTTITTDSSATTETSATNHDSPRKYYATTATSATSNTLLHLTDRATCVIVDAN